MNELIYKYTSELKKQGLLRNNKRTPFQKTETLLYNYNNFKAAIQDKHDQIEEIKNVGLRKEVKDNIHFFKSYMKLNQI